MLSPVSGEGKKLRQSIEKYRTLMGEMVEIHLKDELVSGETTPEQRAQRMAEIGQLLRAYLK
ncbi:MAG: hypothetical protein EGS01_04710 [Cronobacter sakazakii]|nr:hypothetical protein [Cronobacter sakazakii]